MDPGKEGHLRDPAPGGKVGQREPVLWSFEEAELRYLFLDYHVMASGFNGGRSVEKAKDPNWRIS